MYQGIVALEAGIGRDDDRALSRDVRAGREQARARRRRRRRRRPARAAHARRPAPTTTRRGRAPIARTRRGDAATRSSTRRPATTGSRRCSPDDDLRVFKAAHAALRVLVLARARRGRAAHRRARRDRGRARRRRRRGDLRVLRPPLHVHAGRGARAVRLAAPVTPTAAGGRPRRSPRQVAVGGALLQDARAGVRGDRERPRARRRRAREAGARAQGRRPRERAQGRPARGTSRSPRSTIGAARPPWPRGLYAEEEAIDRCAHRGHRACDAPRRPRRSPGGPPSAIAARSTSSSTSL